MDENEIMTNERVHEFKDLLLVFRGVSTIALRWDGGRRRKTIASGEYARNFGGSAKQRSFFEFTLR